METFTMSQKTSQMWSVMSQRSKISVFSLFPLEQLHLRLLILAASLSFHSQVFIVLRLPKLLRWFESQTHKITEESFKIEILLWGKIDVRGILL